MEFEFDLSKSESNRVKHGIGFVQAQKLWLDARRIEIAAKTKGENRFLMVAIYQNRFWSAVFTYRANKIRIISVRRSREEEVKLYES